MIRKYFLMFMVVIIAILSLPFLLIYKLTKNQYYSLKCLNVLCRIINFISGNKVSVEGFEKIKDLHPYMIVANHRSLFDIISIFSFINQPIVFVAKQELRKIPIAAGWFASQDTVFVNRGNKKSGMQTIKQIITMMKEERNIGIFPGGRTSRGYVPFQSPLIEIAKKNKYPLVCMSIMGTEKNLECRTSNKKVNTKIIIHDVLSYEEYKDIPINELVAKLEELVYTPLGEYPKDK